MAIYLPFYFFGVLLVFFSYDKYFRIISNQFILFIFCLILICFAGFRYGIASDYWSYYDIFNETGDYDRLETGFKFLISFYKFVFKSRSYNGFVFFIAFLSVSIKYLFFRKMLNPFIALLIYISVFYFILEYNGIRAGLASALNLNAVYLCIKNKKKILYFFLIGLASSIHISSLLFFPLYIILSRDIYLRKQVVIFFLLILLLTRFFFMEYILSNINLLLLNLRVTKINQLMLDQAMRYFHVKDVSIFNLGLIRRITIIMLFILLSKDKKINNGYFFLYTIGTSLYILFMGYDIISYRMSLVFDVFMIPLFADLKIKYNYKNFIIIVSLSLVLFVLYFVTIRSEGYVIPYKTYIFN